MKPLLPGSFSLQLATVVAVVGGVGLGATLWQDVEAVNTGYRGLGMVALQTTERSALLDQEDATYPDAIHDEEPYLPDADSVNASEIYENVQVLGDLTSDNFNRLMLAITQWVAPEQGCAYCHGESGNFASDDLYTKVVARRMLQMTRNINANWSDHVADTGVTCYTCHRGQPVPEYLWFREEHPRTGMSLGATVGQNVPNPNANYSSLPLDAFELFLEDYERPISVISQQVRTEPLGPSIKDAEATYGLMLHLSQSLGVNCTFCHNSRSFYDWDQSTPKRVTALAGLGMVREINLDYLAPLVDAFPPERLGPTGDAAKANCLTCHQGRAKPLGGYSIIDHWPELQVEEGAPVYAAADATGEANDGAAAEAETGMAEPEGGEAEPAATDETEQPAEPSAAPEDGTEQESGAAEPEAVADAEPAEQQPDEDAAEPSAETEAEAPGGIFEGLEVDPDTGDFIETE